MFCESLNDSSNKGHEASYMTMKVASHFHQVSYRVPGKTHVVSSPSIRDQDCYNGVLHRYSAVHLSKHPVETAPPEIRSRSSCCELVRCNDASFHDTAPITRPKPPSPSLPPQQPSPSADILLQLLSLLYTTSETSAQSSSTLEEDSVSEAYLISSGLNASSR